MTLTINSLWPEQIRAHVRSPFAILQEQAKALTDQTEGVLVGEVSRRETDQKKIKLTFNVVVPALGDYRHYVLGVAHERELFYPVLVEAEVFRPIGGTRVFLNFLASPEGSSIGSEGRKPLNQADSDQELTELVGKVLQSSYVVSVAQSLIARANEAVQAEEAAAQDKSHATSDSACPPVEPTIPTEETPPEE